MKDLMHNDSNPASAVEPDQDRLAASLPKSKPASSEWPFYHLAAKRRGARERAQQPLDPQRLHEIGEKIDADVGDWKAKVNALLDEGLAAANDEVRALLDRVVAVRA